MSKIDGKILRKCHYEILKDLGIEIVMYDLKTHEDNSTSGMHQNANGKVSYGFELYGSLNENVDFDELLLLLQILKLSKDSNSVAVQEMYNELLTLLHLTEKHK